MNNVVYTKIAFIRGMRVTAFIDLGSERTLLKEHVANRLMLRIESESSMLKGFAGGVCTTLGAVAEDIEIDGVTNSLRILVVPDDAMQYDLIVGDDFFNKKGVTVLRTADSIVIQYEEAAVMNVETEKEDNTVVRTPLTMGDLNIGLSVSENVKSKLFNLVSRYRNCFATNIGEIGYTDIETMHITLKEDKVVRHVPYRVAYGQRKYLQAEIKELLANDIIEESTSEFASPVVIVPKRTGGHRMCVDYRMLNGIIQKEFFPTNLVEEEINNLSDKRVFTLLDMMSGYLQIGVDENSRKYTAFVTPDGQF